MSYKIDYWLISSILVLLILGLLIVASLSVNDNPPYYHFYRQLIIVSLSLFLCLFFSLIDYRLWRNSSYLIVALYLILLLSLFFVFVFGRSWGGSLGWFSLGNFNIQPAEFMKIALILVLAKYFSSRHLEIWQWRHIFISGIFVALPMSLTILQPDLASALIFLFIWLGIVLLSGIRIKQILILFLIFSLLALLSWNFVLKPYQKERLISFLNPESDIRGSGYNMRQSLIAIGSGGLLGKGLGWGTQTQLKFLPAAKTDFIFASLAEEVGLMGVLIVFITFGLLFWRLSLLALNAPNNFAYLFISGFLIKLIIETSVNLGMNLGLLPIAGLPLPFLSYGGSHLMADFLALGIIFNIRQNIVLG